MRGFAHAQGRAPRADRRRRRRRAPGGARARCATRSCGCARSASSTTTRASRGCADRARAQGARHHRRELAHVLDDVEPDEVVIAIPSAPGTLRARVVTACRERGVPGAHDADRVRAAAGRRRQLRHPPAARGPGRGHARPRAGADGARARRRATWPARSCWSPAPAARSAPSCAARSRASGPRRLVLRRPRRGQPVRDRARARGGPPRRSTPSPVLADCKEEERMREVFAEHRPTVVFHAAAYKHVGDDGAQPGRGGPQQRARHARGGARSPASAGVSTFVLVSTDKAVEAGDGDGRLQGARRVGGRGRRRALPATRRSRPCASATCSARRARWCRSSAARSPPAAR